MNTGTPIRDGVFFFGGPDYYSPRLLRVFWDLGHFFFFALFVVLLDRHWCSQRRSIRFRIGASLITLVLAGLAIELIQLSMADRSFSWNDFFRDLAGGGFVLFWRIGWGTGGRVAAATILVFSFIPFEEMVFDEYRAHKDFPLLAGFESIYELSRWSGKAELSEDTDVFVQGASSGKMRLTTDTYSGISLNHFPGDWSGRSGLAFSVYNPGSRIKLHYRIHDILHKDDQEYANRFNGRTDLDSGWNEIVIPMEDILHGPQDRTMNLKKIRGFGVFVVRQKERRVLYLDNVRLL